MVKRTSPKRRETGIKFEEGSGNVFADLGLPNPERELLKARLTLEIYRILKERLPSVQPTDRSVPVWMSTMPVVDTVDLIIRPARARRCPSSQVRKLQQNGGFLENSRVWGSAVSG
jgi:hypothetical protein